MPLSPSDALKVLSEQALQAFYAYAAELDLSDPESASMLTAYAERLADWLEASMAPIIEAATPRVLH
ncbi:hypothetical protein [Devosia sp. XK-2]|uniref:hypothetical protein n=1 Tax=Devosia sp. XK-2 TaxID=3126689 RepID=UPI0030D00AFF